MTLLAYLAQQHRFAKWQIRKLENLDAFSENERDDLYFFMRLRDYIQQQRDYHWSLRGMNVDEFLDSLDD